jgi:MFS family permease
MTAGSLAGGLLVLAWSQVHDLVLFYLVWIGIGLAMACVLYEAAFTVVTKWFRVRRRQALTAVTLVGGWASFVFSPLSSWLIDVQGWRHALITLAIILAAATVPLHGLFLRPPPKHREQKRPRSCSAIRRRRWPKRRSQPSHRSRLGRQSAQSASGT